MDIFLEAHLVEYPHLHHRSLHRQRVCVSEPGRLPHLRQGFVDRPLEGQEGQGVDPESRKSVRTARPTELDLIIPPHRSLVAVRPLPSPNPLGGEIIRLVALTMKAARIVTFFTFLKKLNLILDCLSCPTPLSCQRRNASSSPCSCHRTQRASSPGHDHPSRFCMQQSSTKNATYIFVFVFIRTLK